MMVQSCPVARSNATVPTISEPNGISSAVAGALRKPSRGSTSDGVSIPLPRTTTNASRPQILRWERIQGRWSTVGGFDATPTQLLYSHGFAQDATPEAAARGHACLIAWRGHCLQEVAHERLGSTPHGLHDHMLEGRPRMKRIALRLVVAASLVGVAFFLVPSSRQAHGETAPIFVRDIPPGYREWRLISVAHEEGDLNDLRAILGNDVAMKAYREQVLPFPDGTIIARLAWSHDPSAENNKAFGRPQSFVAGLPKNGVQFMVKDSKKYASTGGWGFAHLDDGKSAPDAVLNKCFSCHEAVQHRDLVFTRYAP